MESSKFRVPGQFSDTHGLHRVDATRQVRLRIQRFRCVGVWLAAAAVRHLGEARRPSCVEQRSTCGYDAWLWTYAQALLEGQKGMASFSDSDLLNLRSALIERLQWWKAEVRRYLTEQRKHASRAKEEGRSAAEQPQKAGALDDLRAKQAQSLGVQNSATSTQDVESISTNTVAGDTRDTAKKMGRGRPPATDAEYERALELRKSGKKWPQIKNILNPEFNSQRTAEAWRCLVKTRSKLTPKRSK